MTFNDDAAGWSADTQAVRGGLDRTNFQETTEPVFLNSGFVYESAAAAERAFTGEDERFVYSRYGNPRWPPSRSGSGCSKAPRRASRRRRACQRCSPPWVPCWLPVTGWLPRGPCSVPAL